jgi:prevent-host-death family protein
MRWKIGEAKQHLSEVVRQAAKRPQILCNREAPVAAIVDAHSFEEFENWRRTRRQRSVTDALRELQDICSSEDYALELPSRQDRPSGPLGHSPRVPR